MGRQRQLFGRWIVADSFSALSLFHRDVLSGEGRKARLARFLRTYVRSKSID